MGNGDPSPAEVKERRKKNRWLREKGEWMEYEMVWSKFFKIRVREWMRKEGRRVDGKEA